MGWLIELLHVLRHHTVAIELRAQLHERLFDAPYPLGWDAFIASLIIHRHNFVFQYGVDGPGVDLVLVFRVRLAVADGPATRDLVGFIEPPVQNAQIQDAVDAGLHATGTARLFAAARIVQPE